MQTVISDNVQYNSNKCFVDIELMIHFEDNERMQTPVVAPVMGQRITLYRKAWGKPDHELRRSMLGSIMESSARYTDPKVDSISVAQMSNHIGQVHLKWPGAKLVRTSGLDLHHNVHALHGS